MKMTRKHLPLLAIALLVCAGCRSWWSPPPGEPTATFAGTPPPTLRPTPDADLVVTQMRLTPQEFMAPVGAEVPLVCSLCEGGYVPANQRVDWNFSPESVGEFVAASVGGEENLFAPLTFQPQLTPRHVVGVTAPRETTLRGAGPAGQAVVRPGQAYVVVRSMQEGTSQVTATAAGGDPNRVDASRQQTAVIHWIDAQWVLPQSQVEPSGTSHRLTTIVTRRSDNAPKPGWIVKYDVLGGAAAGFAPDFAQSAEAPTDAEGRATVELVQRQASRGTTQVRVQIVRPAELGGQPLVVGHGTADITWTADVGLRVTGPAQGGVGQELPYRVELANPTAATLRNVAIELSIPAGMSLVDSQPQAGRDATGRVLLWQVPEMGPNTQASITATLRGDQAGTMNVCASLRAADGLSAQQCVKTTIGSSKIEVRMTPPKDVELDQKATFGIQVTNLGPGAASNLQLRAFFDDGLQHAAGKEIFYDLGTLEEGETRSLSLKFTIVKLDALCNRVEVLGPGGKLASAEGCATAKAATPPPPPGAKKPALSLEHLAPRRAETGGDVTFTTRVTNTGNTPLTKISVSQALPEALLPLQASANHAYKFTTQHELTWTVETLAAGEAIKLEAQCRCQSAGELCSAVVVTSGEGLRETKQACVEVASPTSALTLEVSDNTDPVLVGREVIYRIKVTNIGQVSQKNVLVEATLPEGAVLLPVGTGAMGFTHSRERQQLKFSPIAELKAGASQEIRVVLRAEQAGRLVLMATARGEGASAPVRAEAGTDVTAK